MKERIIQYLDAFAHNRRIDLEEEIKKELNLDATQLQEKSKEVLSWILHHYSQFAISTIDAFFQKVIRSFTREAGLLGNFRLEVDNEYVLDEVIADLMDELGHNDQLTQWMIEFSRDRLSEGENWNVVYALKSFSQEIFKEQFKQIEEEILATDRSAEDNRKVLNTLQGSVTTFMNYMKVRGQQALDILKQNGITLNDFNFKDQGTAYKYFLMFSSSNYQDIGARIEAAGAGSSSWPSKATPNRQRLIALADQQLIPILRDMVQYNKENYSTYKSAQEVLKNYYAFGLITDITRKLKTYREENNVMLLSDASKFLNRVINDSDTPFIYEKVGSWFRNYLIDEFQDTSGFQWKNFLPLLKESADQNNANMIVGDVKQSIYRWRGGDLELLQRDAEVAFGEHRTTTVSLDTNFRSAGNIVSFNNKLFADSSGIVSGMVEDALPAEVFGDATQQPFRWTDKGFVRMSFVERGEDDEWQENVIRQIPRWLETLQDHGARLKDIAILVRKNEEGQRVANYLLQFQNSSDAKPGYKYDVVSNESLRLDTSHSVNVLLAALRLLKNPTDKISRGQLAFEVAVVSDLGELFLKAASDQLIDGILPEEFTSQFQNLKKLSLFELVEELIRIFKLGERQEELSYLQAFQDQILDFSIREKADIVSFLDWWELYKGKKSIKVSPSVDAANILTIHMSKGLQFKYVIVPFCNWKLDHDVTPLMWVKSQVPPFNSLGAVAVRYSRSLKETLFGPDYQKEHTKAHLDNLNLLYVACTRAEAGLIVYAPRPSEKSAQTPNSVGDLVFKVLHGNGEFASHFRGADFEWGAIGPVPDDRVREEVSPISLTSYESADWRSKLVIKREGSEFFEDEVSDKRRKINRGILLHTVLSRIEYKADSATKLKNFFLENALPPEDVAAIELDVQRILNHSQIGTWFTNDWKIKAEALVLLPGGIQKRIDRVMLGKTKTVIVDYKTGDRKKVDREQVEMYATVLTGMGYPNVQAFLVYLTDLKVEEVVSKSNLSLF